MPVDVPDLQYQEACVVQAAAYYQANPDLIRAVIRTEGGKSGQVKWNKDGSFDMGPMQINSVHLPELSKYGITRDMLVNNYACLNIYIGTYLLQKNIMTSADFWHGVGKYHSATPSLNIAYQYRVWGNLIQNGRVRQ